MLELLASAAQSGAAKLASGGNSFGNFISTGLSGVDKVLGVADTKIQGFINDADVFDIGAMPEGVQNTTPKTDLPNPNVKSSTGSLHMSDEGSLDGEDEQSFQKGLMYQIPVFNHADYD